MRRGRGGKLILDLPDRERELIGALLPQMRELLVGGDPSLERLFPPAYADDPEREAEYRSLVHDDLLERRLATIDVVEQTLTATTLDEEQLTAWMAAVNDMRLALGTRLDITEDREDLDDIGPDHPDAASYAVYQYLTFLMGDIVDTLADW